MNLWYVNEFHIQLLALELVLCRRLPKRPGFLFRLIPAAAVYIALPALWPGGFLSPVFRIGEWFELSFLVMLIVSALLIWVSYEVSLKHLVFICCVAHTLQHMAHCISRVFWFLLPLDQVTSQIVELLIVLAVLALVFVYTKKDRLFGMGTAGIQSPQLIIFAMVSTFVVYFMSFWSYWNEGENVGEQFFDALSCGLLLIILLDIFRFRRAEEEQIILKRLLRQEEEQHQMSRATVEVINRKCHDLKHQISALRNMPQRDQEESISELEKSILLYDNLPKTGNEDLDIVLAGKTFLAEKQQVRIQSIVDGGAFSFMSAEDICSLFGNAIDNAVEAAAREQDPEKRIVNLQSSRKGNMLTIHIDNPCKAQPVFVDGIPLTQKADTDYHGFGMRSIRYVTDKYGGVLSAGWENGVFSLDVLFLLTD